MVIRSEEHDGEMSGGCPAPIRGLVQTERAHHPGSADPIHARERRRPGALRRPEVSPLAAPAANPEKQKTR